MNKTDTLCLIDDDTIFQFLTKKIVTENKLVNQIKIFSNGLDAINFFKSVTDFPHLLPEVILLDLAMSIMDGWSFLEEYIALQPKLGKKITLYIASSSIDPKDINKAKSISSVTDYIVKPISKESLTHMLRNL